LPRSGGPTSPAVSGVTAGMVSRPVRSRSGNSGRSVMPPATTRVAELVASLAFGPRYNHDRRRALRSSRDRYSVCRPTDRSAATRCGVCSGQPWCQHRWVLSRRRPRPAARSIWLGRGDGIGLGRTARLSAPAAAFINAWQMQNQEFDCLHEGAVVHAMASVLPARSCAAGVTGADLIVAIAVGVDIAASLGPAARAGFR
jgi:MmgE/PrpD N-terminal domain